MLGASAQSQKSGVFGNVPTAIAVSDNVGREFSETAKGGNQTKKKPKLITVEIYHA
jgi:hypothetical protein